MDYALKHFELDCDLINENEIFKQTLKECFRIDYKERPSAEALFESPFFAKYTTE